ncbi:MAG: tetratricopeptide repeat protein [Planctomycetes bacterium]|nr:tetratricopeptide repeat protein [Planctomycetota bacterium]
MYLMLLQTGDEIPIPSEVSPEVYPEYGEPYSGDYVSPFFWLSGGMVGLFGLLALAFWIWMLIHCYRNEPDRFFWIWLMIIFGPGSLIVSVIYFLVRWLPGNEIKTPTALKRWTRGREIERLAIAAHQIGNAHQHIQLGHALLETGQHDRAGEAYRNALEKDPENLQALWGAAQVDMQNNQFDSAAQRLSKLLSIDPQYKFGDVSLAYGKTLYELGNFDGAREHLEGHIQRWRHPGSLFLLATLEHEQNNHTQAREHLYAMLQDINGSPKAIARKFGIWKSKARKLLKKLPR